MVSFWYVLFVAMRTRRLNLSPRPSSILRLSIVTLMPVYMVLVYPLSNRGLASLRSSTSSSSFLTLLRRISKMLENRLMNTRLVNPTPSFLTLRLLSLLPSMNE